MKKIYLTMVCALAVILLRAQTLSPFIIASAGGFASNGSQSISYTVAEMTMISTFSNNGRIFTQGFHQPENMVIDTTGISPEILKSMGLFAVYPNPAGNNVTMEFTFAERGRITVSLYNTLGQRIAELYKARCEEGGIATQANTSAYAAGSYFVKAEFTAEKNGAKNTISKMLQIIH